VLSAVATVPVALFAGVMIGSFYFMHFEFKGEIQDYTKGDALGELLYACIFAVILTLLTSIVWICIYRRLSNRLGAEVDAAKPADSPRVIH
jgi:hypothetical protein